MLASTTKRRRPFVDLLRVSAAMVLLLGVAAPRAAAQGADYLVGAQDVLAIQVFDQADLGGRYSVEADGSISFPLIGRVKVAGLTLRDVETLLKKELAEGFFKSPQVSVAVEQYRSQRVFVVGEVRAPGTYTLTGEMTLIEALARAGSITAEASGEALIVRPKSGKTADRPVLPDNGDTIDVTRVDVKELQSGRLSQNAQLQDGDTIFVPRAELVYIVGQVRNPGSYALQRGMTVLQALSLAGGATDRGATGRTEVVRSTNGKRTGQRVKLEDRVEPGDTIVVPERFF